MDSIYQNLKKFQSILGFADKVQVVIILISNQVYQSYLQSNLSLRSFRSFFLILFQYKIKKPKIVFMINFKLFYKVFQIINNQLLQTHFYKQWNILNKLW